MQVNSVEGSIEKPSRDSWSVVATVREPLPVVLAFVAHHLSIGASEVHIYLDDPEDPAAEILQSCPQCHVTLCNDRHMKAMGFTARPENQNQRQKRNANHALKATKAQWMAHLDADEFLTFPRDVGEVLAGIPEEKLWVQVPHLERFWSDGDNPDTLFDGPFRFRSPDRKNLCGELFGGENTLHQMGHAGTVAGKAILRTGKGCRLGIHRPRQGVYSDKKIPPVIRIKNTGILHFHGATARAWASKTARYGALTGGVRKTILATARLRQIDAFKQLKGDVAREDELHRRMFYMSEEQIDVLRGHGLLREYCLETEAAVARYFPDVERFPTPAEFDQRYF